MKNEHNALIHKDHFSRCLLFYQDLDLHVTLSRFREEAIVPADAAIIKETWRYVNKDSSADQRYKGTKLPLWQDHLMHTFWHTADADGLKR